MHFCQKPVLKLPNIESVNSFKYEMFAQESLKFYNENILSGKGIILYPNIFHQINIEFSKENHIDFKDKCVKEGKHEISRPNSEVYLWDPIIMSYVIKSASSPLSVLHSNQSLKIKLKSAATKVKSLKLEIFISDQSSRPQLKLLPQNLSHRTNFVKNDFIKWEIESIYYGSEYSMIFTNCIECFKIKRIEVSFIVIDELSSGFEIGKCNVKLKSSSKYLKSLNVPIKIQSVVEETYCFDN